MHRMAPLKSRPRSVSPVLGLALALGVAACRAAGPAAVSEDAGPVATWGSMREVLREGRSEARVSPVQVARAGSIGVGALAGLAGEITILDGRVLVAEGSPAPRSGEAPAEIHARAGNAEDQAALLVLAEVPAWIEVELDACSSYGELDAAIASHLRARGHDLREPIPVRVRGKRGTLELHVIAGACPIANPSGPPPWRHSGAFDAVEIVGFFAEGAAGRLTHHTHSSHLHAIVGEVMGHLDNLTLEAGALLLLPAP